MLADAGVYQPAADAVGTESLAVRDWEEFDTHWRAAERMPGTDSNSGRCSLLYHSLNSCTCWASISTYTMKIPRPFCAICPSPLWSEAAILCLVLLAPGPHAWSPGETRDTNWGAILADIPQIPGLLSAIFRLIEAHRNEIRAQPASFAANRSGCSPRSHSPCVYPAVLDRVMWSSL